VLLPVSVALLVVAQVRVAERWTPISILLTLALGAALAALAAFFVRRSR